MSFNITVQPSGRTYVAQADEALLAAAIRNGIGLPYEVNPAVSEDTRRKLSDTMKAHHRKTGKGTLLGNAMARRNRKPKP